ncbi:MAG: gamma-glutamyltransferase [Acidobacteria bacterium]|nr:gamma-glutamyltransferase [Acidobacteriota bacterium]
MRERCQLNPGDRPAGNAHGTRSPVLARKGVIATSQPLASAAGLQVLQAGGNAIDAAVTAAAVLAVVEPTMTGIGGDVFAIVYDRKTKALRGLNSSGRAGSNANADALIAKGMTQMPGDGVYPITVPGAVAGWAELLEKHGTITLARALAPATGYAREGFPVSEIIADQWVAATGRVSQDPAAAAVFLPGGRAPKPGEIFRNPDLANTLEQIARGGRDAFYRGPIGAAIAADMQKRGGFLTSADLAAHRADWVDPIGTSYRGYDLYELPPNTQGFVALEILNILEGYDVGALGHNSAEYLHLLAEAKRIAFADRAAYLADPRLVPPSTLKALISKDYAAARRREIDPGRAATGYQPGAFGGTSSHDAFFDGRDRGDTVYLAAADVEGNAISFINSLFSEFGSGIVVQGTGIVLHNRGAGFTLEKDHPNCLAPGKRPLHTLVPAFVMKDGKPFMPFGVMGGDNQAQAHVQVIVNIVDFGMNVQEAGEAARVRHGGDVIAAESGIGEAVRASLRQRGHVVIDGRGLMGGYQAVMIDPMTGVLMGGSDPRKDGLAIGW